MNDLRAMGSPAVVVDGGNLFFCRPQLKPLERDQLIPKARVIVEAYNEIGVAAVALGPYDFAGGYSTVLELKRLARFPLLCANLVSDSGAPALDPYSVIEVAGVRIGLIGVMDPPAEGSWLASQDKALRFEPAYRAVKQYAKELKAKGCQFIAVLSSMDPKKFRLLAHNLQEVDLYVAGDPEDKLSIPWSIGSAMIANSSQLGRYLGDIQVQVAGPEQKASMKHRFVALKPEFPDDPTVKRAVDNYYNFVAMVKTAEPEKYVEDKEHEVNLKYGHGVYVSAVGCQQCHPAQYATWEKTRHANAFSALPPDRRNSVECLECHVTGFGERGGFFPTGRGPELTGVQCEACHGPGSLHPASAVVRGRVEAKQTCQRCHTRARSPAFKLKSYLQKIGCSSTPRP